MASGAGCGEGAGAGAIIGCPGCGTTSQFEPGIEGGANGWANTGSGDGIGRLRDWAAAKSCQL